MENIFDAPATREWIRRLASENNRHGLYEMMYNNINLYDDTFVKHPSEFKLEVLKECLDYYTSKEDYEKCMRLIQIRNICLKK